MRAGRLRPVPIPPPCRARRNIGTAQCTKLAARYDDARRAQAPEEAFRRFRESRGARTRPAARSFTIAAGAAKYYALTASIELVVGRTRRDADFCRKGKQLSPLAG